MKKFPFYFLVICISCNSKQQKYDNITKKDSNATIIDSQRVQSNSNITELKENELFYKEDTITFAEKKFLNKISSENEFIGLSNKVRRFFLIKDSSLFANEMLFTNEYIQNKGYVYLNLKFYGKISEPNIYYTYSLGQTSYGFGSVIGNDTSNYLHSLKSCGITNCIIQVYQNGRKIFDKTEDN